MNLNAERKSYSFYLTVLLIVYGALYGALIAGAHFRPYVMDNNESYSVLWHARNMYEQSFWKSFGVTDESFTPDPAGHPMLHTHQGNMPRLFGFFIYVLGARSIESQILVTTAIVGTLAVIAAYSYFALIGGALFGFICAGLLMTDYILFAQWHVNTYRVWYPLLFFGVCLSIHGLASPFRRRWRVVLAACFFLLFYGELVFAVMVAIFSVLYLFFVHRKNAAVIRRAVVTEIAAASAAILVLIVQLSAVFGPAVVLQDYYLTFFSRNSAQGMIEADLRSFFEQHNIAYWYNIFDAAAHRTFGAFVQSESTINLQVYTPVLVAAALILIAGVMLGQFSAARKPVARYYRRIRLAVVGRCAIFGFLAVAPVGIALWLLVGGAEFSWWAAAGFIAAGILLALLLRSGPRALRDLALLARTDPDGVKASLRLAIGAVALLLASFLPYAVGRTPFGMTSAVLLNTGFKLVYIVFFISVLIAAVRPAVLFRLVPLANPLEGWVRRLDDDPRMSRIVAAALATGVAVPLCLILGLGTPLWPWLKLYLIFVFVFSLTFLKWASISRAVERRVGSLILAAAQGAHMTEDDAGAARRRWRTRAAAAIIAGVLLPFAIVLIDHRSPDGWVFGRYSLLYALMLAAFFAMFVTGCRCIANPDLTVAWARRLHHLFGDGDARLDPAGAAVALPGRNGAERRADSTLLAFAKLGTVFVTVLPAVYAILTGVNIFGMVADDPMAARRTLSLVLSLLVAGAGTFLMNRRAGGGWTRVANLPLESVALTLVFALYTAAFVQHHGALYQQDFSLLWTEPLRPIVIAHSVKFSVVAVFGLAWTMIVLGSRRILGEEAISATRNAMVFFLIAQLAYAVVYILSPGYVLTGYQWRHAPFTVFSTCIIPALAIYLPAMVTITAWESARRSTSVGGDARTRLVRNPAGRMAAISAATTVVLGLYWVYVQVTYVRLLPPTHYSRLKDLRGPAYKGKTFVVNTYAAPVAEMTGAWAYFDPLLTSGWRKTADGYELPQDGRYLWFADGRINASYKRPDYYVCMMPQRLEATVAKLSRNTHPRLFFHPCSTQGLVHNLLQNSTPFSDFELTDADFETDHWAVVKLDHSFPPFLETLTGDPFEAVNLSLTYGRNNEALIVADYDVAHLRGEPELGSVLEVYGSNGALACATSGVNWTKLYEGQAVSVPLPTHFDGLLQAFVTPKSALKTGRRYRSQIIRVDAANLESAVACTGAEPPVPVSGLKVVRVNPAAIQLYWLPSPGSSRFRIHISRGGEPPREIALIDYEPRYTVTGVNAVRKHRFRVTACNPRTGACSWATPLKGESSESLPDPQPVRGLEVARLSGEKALATWKPSAYADYYEFDSRQKGGEFESVSRRDHYALTEWSTELDPRSAYEMRVRACANGNCGPYSDVTAAPIHVPLAAPGGFRATHLEPSVILVKWKEDPETLHYLIEISSGAGDKAEFRQVATVSQTNEFTIEQLDATESYRLRMRACRHALGDCSPYTPVVEVRPGD